MSRENRQALLRWSTTNAQPCYCNDPYPLDVTWIQATPETLACIFAIPDKDSIIVEESKEGKRVELVDGSWPLEAQREYTVSTTDPMDTICPIRKTFSLFPGKDDEEKCDRIHALSKNFYAKIWHDKDTPENFKKTFITPVSSDEIQAYRQFNWFLEVFGGPSMFEENGQGEKHYLPRTMAKHTASRMTLEYAITWLKLMKESMEEEFMDAPKVKEALGVYWLHFYAMFPFSDVERREFREVIREHFVAIDDDDDDEQLGKEVDQLDIGENKEDIK